MATLLVPGRRTPATFAPLDAGADARPALFLDARVREAVDVASARGDADYTALTDVADDEVLEVALEGDVTLWTRFDDLRDELRAARVRGYPKAAGQIEGDTVRLGPQLYLGEPTRALGGLAIRALRRWGVDLPSMAASAIARRIESKLAPGPGLYHCPDPRALGDVATRLPTTDPLLVFLHGTASNTAGSFGGLTEGGPSATWRALHQQYPERLLAFEHPTLSLSPLANALALAESLPDDVRLHLVTHSRGGLVGEILARASITNRTQPFGPRDLERFERAEGRDEDLRLLRALNEVFEAKRLRVERLVRVACPAAGTTLAARRLDRYLSVVVNLLKRIPFVQTSAVFEFTSALLLALVKKRTDPAELPGLEAMMPTSPLVQVLNDPTVRLGAELAVIAGDVQGSGFWRRLKVLATNLYYREDHDFVVNTASMLGGSARATPAYYFFDRGSDVDHFHYFRNGRTQQALGDGLAGRLTEATGYRPIPRPELAAPALRTPLRDTGTRPAVFVLPGIMGSHLRVEGDRVWVHLLRLLRGDIRRLGIEADEVEPHALVGSAYADLLTYLDRRYDVIPFPYDWRQSVTRSGKRLAEAIQARLNDAPGLPVHLLAHSMGGLVARAMMQQGDVWDRLKALGGRFVMLGTPNGGSYLIRDVLLGRAHTLRKLALVDIRHSLQELAALVAQFPGLLELLPGPDRHADDTRDYFSLAVWDELNGHGDAFARPEADRLRQARALYEEVLDDALLDPDHVIYVAGQDAFTPIHHEFVDGDGGRNLRYLATTEGDGRVPWASGIPDPLRQAGRVWYMDAPHGKMADHLPAFRALRDLLDTGTTDKLSQTPPRRRAVPTVFEMPDFPPETIPDALDLEATAVGFEPAPPVEAEPLDRVDVFVTHGDLAYARYPVAVGHHLGDGLVSAEGALDGYLDGRLHERHALGLYPGPIGTSLLLVDADNYPPGAVVLGLGAFGTLTAGGLARTYTQAALRLILHFHEQHTAARERARRDGTPLPPAEPPRLSTLLVGSGYGGLTPRQVLRAALEGVQAANERARQVPNALPIAALECIELYEDRALQAWHVLRTLLDEQAFAAYRLRYDHLRRTHGGLRSVIDRSQPNWWQRVRVQGVAENDKRLPALAFTSLTDRARAEVRNLPVQRTLVDSLLHSLSRETTWDRDAAQMLFELLIPNAFKPYAADQRNILWIVDAASAAYPWELLYDASFGDEPMAIRSGMLRQYAITDYRERPAPATDRRALVVGDPKSDFVELPGAQREAKAVRDRLDAADWDAVHLHRPEAAAVLRDVLSTSAPYQILHLAGHGVVDYRLDGEDGTHETLTGMVLGTDVVLTPAILEQARVVPDLVFVNCCHLGRVDPTHEALARDRHRLGANLGTQLIKMGVRAVVVAGWAVDDGAALTFADAFYERMLAGAPFGEAVRHARATTYEQHPGTNTWGAYQCYGDPYFQLRDADGGVGGGARTYADPAEVITDLYNLAQQAATASTRDTALRDRLARQLDALPEPWRARAELLEAAFLAYEALDLLPEAAALFGQLRQSEQASYQVATQERGALLLVRHGVQLATDDAATDAARRQGEDLVEAGLALLDGLLAQDETAERLATLGSARKHRLRLLAARLRTLAEREDAQKAQLDLAGEAPDADADTDALEEELQTVQADREAVEEAVRVELRAALDAYERAFDRYPADPHPLFNRVMLEAVRTWLTSYRSGELDVFDEPLRQALEAAQAEEEEAPAFWHVALPASHALYRLLHPEVTDPAERDNHRVAMREVYRRAWKRGGAYRIRRSLDDHFAVLIDLLELPGFNKYAAREPLAASLRVLREELWGELP